jgi:hypothetical protein
MELALDLNAMIPFWGKDSILAPCYQSEANRKSCIETIAVHEFGHALGIRHEQDRSDVPSPCDREESFQPGAGTTFGDFDADSIMNYCKAGRILMGANLSEQDKRGIQALYGEGGAVNGGTADIGRPNVVVTSLIPFAPYPLPSGSLAFVDIQYRGVTDPSKLPKGPYSIEIEDGDRTALPNVKLEADPRAPNAYRAHGPWMIKDGPGRKARIYWNGRVVREIDLGPKQ